jgi:hypothetical protein
MKAPLFVRTFLGILVILASLDASLAASTDSGLTLVKSSMIWSAATYNSFTDLEWYNNRFYCTFREGTGHVSPDGKLRILSSADGHTWQSEALISASGVDVRDPKLSVTPTGQLMLTGGLAYSNPSDGVGWRSMVWFSNNGSAWGNGQVIGIDNEWIWRTTWHNGKAYGVGYDATGTAWWTRMNTSSDGIHWSPTVTSLLPNTGSPNEAVVTFKPDGTAYTLMRRDTGTATALLGKSTAASNYTDWTWQDLGVKIGGPDMIALPDGRLVAAVRLYNSERTSLCIVDPNAGTLTEALTLPSAGDTSYAGMVLRGDHLWVSYYGSQTGKACVYMADVAVSAVPEPSTASLLLVAVLMFGVLAWRRYRRSLNFATRTH